MRASFLHPSRGEQLLAPPNKHTAEKGDLPLLKTDPCHPSSTSPIPPIPSSLYLMNPASRLPPGVPDADLPPKTLSGSAVCVILPPLPLPTTFPW